MDHLYYLSNATLTLRIVEFLHVRSYLPLHFMTVIHRLDGWVIRVKFSSPLDDRLAGDFRAFLNELGIAYEPNHQVKMALRSLENGQTPVDVMHQYQIVVVSHGRPDRIEIEAFREQFVQGLGYCPETLV